MGNYTALDDRIVEMVMFAKKNGLKRLIIREDSVVIEFHDKEPEPVSNFNGTAADGTTYYYTDEEVN